MIGHLRPLLRDISARLLRATGLLDPSRHSAGRLSVATFHRVLPASERAEYPLRGLVVTPQELAWFLAYFTQHYTCGTLRGCADRWLAGERPVRPFLALTFDDAQRDNVTHAWPVLERYGVRASFFAPVDAVESDQALWHDQLAFGVARLSAHPSAQGAELLARLELPNKAEPQTDRSPLDVARLAVSRAKALAPAERAEWVKAAQALTGDPRPDWDQMANWSELRALLDAGNEIGSHSLSHELLTQCSDDALEREVAQSRARIEERLDASVVSFCYPNGDCDERTGAAVARAGYRYAVTTAWGNNATGADLHMLRRCDMTGEHVLSARGIPCEARLAWRLSGLHPGLRFS